MAKSRRRTLAAILLTLVFALILPGFYNGLKVVHYTVEAEEITRPVRIALLTDLHSCAWGEGQRILIDALDAEVPDIVLLGGDIFDDELPDDNTEVFLAGIAGRYPCFYVTGNHEYQKSPEEFQSCMAMLERYGVTRLRGDAVSLDINGQRFLLCGIDDSYMWSSRETKTYASMIKATRKAARDDYVILLSHRPNRIKYYAKYGFDLVLSGHTHGGQWRIPFLLNGLYAPNQGWFPEYVGGRYEVGDTTLIISRGLARESTRLPRFYNRPELVIVDIT